MCSDCEEEEPICSFCGDTCWGHCDDPDTCSSCWVYKNDPIGIHLDDYDEDMMEVCMDEGCHCECHDDMHDDMGMRFENGVWKFEDDGPPFVRRGVFQFLKLPGELRQKIYGYAFLQDGDRRKSTYHRGTIHTALLQTCRQIYQEAGNLPLTVNTLNFASALYALNYLGFFLLPSQKDLITSIHVEFFYPEFSTASWELLLCQLAKVPISHLSLTIKGRYTEEAFLGHKCFPNRFAAVMKNIKTFDVNIGSSLITKKVKAEIREEMRETLIKGYKRTKKVKSNTKRSAMSENGDKKPAKKAKKAGHTTKHQTKVTISPKSTRLGLKSQKSQRQEAEAAKEHAKQSLLAQYDQLKQYATSIDLDAASVKIRLNNAREAAEASNASKFEQLAHHILETLDERYNRIVAARQNIPTFAKIAIPMAPTPSPPSPESSDSLDSQCSSQATI